MNLRNTVFIIALLAVSTILFGGYYYYSTVLNAVIVKEHVQAEDFVELATVHINSEINILQKEARLLAENDSVQKALADGDSAAIDLANSVLDSFQKNLEVSVCYILNDNGLTIASSNRDTAKSFVGRKYAFRPYFRQALEGQPFIYLALGITSGEKGIYSSHPVYSGNRDTPAGVVVIKADADLITEMIDATLPAGIFLFHNENGLIFSASQKDWELKFLWEPSPGSLAETQNSRQFGKGPWPWIGFTRIGSHHVTDGAGKKYMVHQEAVKALPGWKFTYFHDLDLLSRRAFGKLFNTMNIAILFIFLILVGMIVYLYNITGKELHRRKAVEDERENLIKELSVALDEIKTLRGIIPICMYCKKIKRDQDVWDQLETYLEEHSDADFSHGVCPDCYQEQLSEIKEIKDLKNQT